MFVSSVPSIQQATTNCIKDQHMPFDHKPRKAQFCQGFNQGWKADAQKIYERGMQKACILFQSKVIRPFTQPLAMPVYTPLIKEYLSPFHSQWCGHRKIMFLKVLWVLALHWLEMKEEILKALQTGVPAVLAEGHHVRKEVFVTVILKTYQTFNNKR